MTESTPVQSGNDPSGSIFGPRQLTQAMVVICIVLGCVLFQAVARWTGFPTEVHFKGSLLQPPMEVGALLMAIIALAVCTAIADLIVGRRWFLAGLFVATGCLATWSARGGRMQYVLLRAENSGAGRSVFVLMFVEHLILSAAVAGLWLWLWAKHAARFPEQLQGKPSDETGRSTGPALLAQVGATLLILLILLGETGVKKQVMVSVFLAGMGGTAVAQGFFATRETARWYWIGPAIAGAVGYLVAFIQPAGLEIGHLSVFPTALARPLPLDYASLGMAGALLGYWVNELVEVDTDASSSEAAGEEKT